MSSTLDSDAAAPIAPWTPRVLHLLQEWSKRAAASSDAHYWHAARLAKRNVQLGVPVVVLTTIVGTSVFASIGSSVDTRLRIVVGLISVAAAVVASLQTFLRFAERGEKHRMAAEQWAAIRREIAEMLALHPNYPATGGDPQTYLDELRQKIDRTAAQSPEIGEGPWKRTQERFGLARGIEKVFDESEPHDGSGDGG